MITYGNRILATRVYLCCPTGAKIQYPHAPMPPFPLRLVWFVLLISASGGPTSPLLAQSGHAERYVLAENVSSEAVDLDGEGVQLSVNAGSMRLELVTPSILHVQVAPQSSFSTRRSLAVLDTTSVVPATARRDGDHLVLLSDTLTARVHTESGRLMVEDAAGRPIATARAPARTRPTPCTTMPARGRAINPATTSKFHCRGTSRQAPSPSAPETAHIRACWRHARSAP